MMLSMLHRDLLLTIPAARLTPATTPTVTTRIGTRSAKQMVNLCFVPINKSAYFQGVVDLQANHLPNKKLPKKSIQYDYNCYPIRIKEINREFMQKVSFIPPKSRSDAFKVHALSSPFLRPIIIDGIGMIKAYWENASDDDEDSHPKFILQDGWRLV